MRKFIISMLAIIMALGLAGAGTLAAFVDTETSAGNSFAAGNFDLLLSDANEFDQDGVTATWTMTNMAPGVTWTGPAIVSLRNVGTIPADHVEIAFSHTIDEQTAPPGVNPVESDTNPISVAGDLAQWIEITLLTYNGSLFHVGYTDGNGNGFFDLQDVTLPPYTDVGGPFDDLPAPPANGAGVTALTMALEFNGGATNDIQGDVLETTVTFTMNQDASQ